MSTALYRRYRPESFADVIGQEHVTEPLTQALRSGRVAHAYLFSGPRGCGKTTSARILARCLNCEQGPTPEPCGSCDSCVALARDGAGTVDVIEIDAASHGGVDDARDLRERAAFGPAQSRFKVYIIDEAHMVTPNGFNALLKVVEEPPPHVKFIFATTEPEKVLATIRSRTHHYPFHLVPPQRLTSYLEQVCEQEQVEVQPGVLSFVTRAGGGSVRDSLSVLDQLISGAGDEGLTYERTASLLGFTEVELLDAVVEAVAAGDAATVFQQVDRVMESGHDPRRFVEDLLERYRDLIVLAAVGDSVSAGGLLPGVPEDEVERMRRQAQSYGPEALSRAGDLVSRGLSEMAGAVSHRLQLELLVARLLLPAAEGPEGYAVRLERLERRLGAGPGEHSREEPGAGQQPVGRRPAQGRAAGGGPAEERPAQGRPAQGRAAQAPSPHQGTAPGPRPATPPPGAPAEQPTPAAGPRPDAPSRPEVAPAAGAAGPGALDTTAMRRHWPDIVTAVRAISRRTAGGLEQAQVLDFDGRRLLIGLPDTNWVQHFTGTSHEEALRQGVLDALALDTRIEATAHSQLSSGGGASRAPSSSPAEGAPPRPGPASGAPPGPHQGPPPQEPPDEYEPPVHQPPVQQPPVPVPSAPSLPDGPPRGRIRSRGGQPQAAPGQAPPSARPAPPATSTPAPRVRGRGTPTDAPEQARGATDPSLAEQLGATGPSHPPRDVAPEWSQAAGSAAAPAWATGEAVTNPSVDDAPSEDDEELATSGAVGQPVIENVLGGTVIAINDDPVG